ncbi:MAG: alanine-glyoxylate transaminase / serine-glyoxylate transaminase / serine-pyruvate transaminase [Clostridia bacterium]|nr:alanine-glyoxylate transaminase / serine-glyoxylate transaminase / serine-pyruvate transaminase [Clostridia bacterium]MDN5323683.1 alanine-glyoxylate transaminase / serine-glyoxylate transaminase / serine-pyruvate transaminase [Clostridia bacterium]
MKKYGELKPSERILMGPGPSNVDPRVLRAMSAPILGHLDPEFLEIMNETMELLRFVFQTKNQLTMAMPGTGSAGMETVLANLIEEGDKVIVCVNGVFGGRMLDICQRLKADVTTVEAPWGKIIEPEQVKEALEKTKAKFVAIVHAETSTGVLQPLEEISTLCKQYDAMILVDCVTSLAGCTVEIDKWGIDAAYSGTQKCLSCPPGLSPVTFSENAQKIINNRKSKVPIWYLDLTMIQNYWGQQRAYHHTAPINMNYALREALRIIYEEGLEQRFARHELNSKALKSGLEAMGIKMWAQEGHRLPMLTSAVIPEGVDDLQVRKYLLSNYGIEIGGGLGEGKGKVWRIGTMGYTCNEKNVLLFLTALESALKEQGYKIETGIGASTAMEIYSKKS